MIDLSLNFQHYVISKSSYHLRLFHSALGDQIWSPIAYSNALFFYGNTFYFSKIIYRFSKYSLENSQFVEFHFFSPKKVAKDTLHMSFIQHETYTVSELVASITEMRTRIINETRKAKRLEPNRKGTFFIIDLEDNQLEELQKDTILQQQLLDLLQHCFDERLYVFLATPMAEHFPGKLIREIDWSVYIGAKNTAFAKAFYEKEEEIFSEKREIIGTLYKKNSSLLIPLHELVFVPSAFKIAQETYAENEEEAYRKFLESL